MRKVPLYTACRARLASLQVLLETQPRWEAVELVLINAWYISDLNRPGPSHPASQQRGPTVQGYLAHKKTPPPRTLQ